MGDPDQKFVTFIPRGNSKIYGDMHWDLKSVRTHAYKNIHPFFLYIQVVVERRRRNAQLSTLGTKS